MAAIVFPLNPTPGFEFTADNEVTYKWEEDGTSWGVWRALGGGSVIIEPPDEVASIETPLILYPPAGAGTGGDATYFPKTSEIKADGVENVVGVDYAAKRINMQNATFPKSSNPEAYVFDGDVTTNAVAGYVTNTANVKLRYDISANPIENVTSSEVFFGPLAGKNMEPTYVELSSSADGSNPVSIASTGGTNVTNGSETATFPSMTVRSIIYGSQNLPQTFNNWDAALPSAIKLNGEFVVSSDDKYTTLTFTNDTAYNASDDSEVGTLAEYFKAGDKIKGSDGTNEASGTLIDDAVDNTMNIVPDPNEWVATDAAGYYSWTSVAYGEPVISGTATPTYVSVASNDTVMYSNDGEKWFMGVATKAISWRDVAYGGGRFVAVANKDSQSVMWSADGINWNAATPADDTVSWQGVTYGGGKFVAVGYPTSGSTTVPRVMYSTNGSSWSGATASGANSWLGVTYGKDKFVAVATNSAGHPRRIMYSATGTGTWTGVNAPVDKAWSSVAYGEPNGQSTFVIVARGGSDILYSVNGGTTWIKTTNPDGRSLNLEDVTYGNGQFIAVASNNTSEKKQVLVSSDGINWEYQTSTEGNSWYGVTYAADKFVAVAKDGSKQVMLLEDGGSFLPGMIVTSEEEKKAFGPDADTLEFVASVPVEETGVVGKWGKAYWEVSKTPDMKDPMTAEKEIVGGREQTLGPKERGNIKIEPDTDYYVTVKYDSESPVAESDPSEVTDFKTAPGGGAYGNFSTTTYPGTGSDQPIGTGVDNTDKALVWIKSRTDGSGHSLQDTLRGLSSRLVTNSTSGNITNTDYITSFNKNGVTISTGSGINTNSQNYVAWNFAAAKGFFDVVTYPGNGTTQDIPHSLGSKPGLIIAKMYDDSDSWGVYHKELGYDKYLYLNMNSSAGSSPDFWQQEPTDSVFSVGDSNNTNQSGKNYVAYLFADNPDGGIKCGSYPGNDSTQEIPCGFKPGWVLIKCYDNTSSANWMIFDSKRQTFGLYANSASEGVDWGGDFGGFTDKGFSLKDGHGNVNQSNRNYIYVAIADTTVQFYDENTYTTVTNHQLTRKYGVDPLNTDLRHLGIYPLTEQPTYTVAYYERVADAYKPIRDYSAEIERLRSRVATLEAGEDTVSPEPEPTPTDTFVVTVQNVGGNNKYFIDGVQQAALSLLAGETYVFDTSDESMSGHPFKLYTSANKASEYTEGVTYGDGTVTLVAPNDTSAQIHYQCELHSLMGGIISID